jgi:hypothetical protein
MQGMPQHNYQWLFGTGERYTFGTTHVDIYPLPPETTPLLFVRGRRNRLAVGDVYNAGHLKSSVMRLTVIYFFFKKKERIATPSKAKAMIKASVM